MASASGSGVKLVTIEENRDEVEENEDRGRVVAGQYALVRTIFTYLPWKDLETSAKVVHFLSRNLVFCICQGMQTVERGFCYLCKGEKEIQQYKVTPLEQLVQNINNVMFVFSFYWEGKKADVSYYSKYPLFQSPHHSQVLTVEEILQYSCFNLASAL